MRGSHVNSLLAYWAGQDGLFAKREHEVLAVLRKTPGLTDREVALAMGSQDPNRSRPRITQLLKDGVLQEDKEEALDPISGKRVRRVRIRPDPRGARWAGQVDFATVVEGVVREAGGGV